MENEIWKIITEFQQGDITKNEAVAKLLLLYNDIHCYKPLISKK